MRPVVENPPERNAGNSDTVFQHFPIFPHTEAKIALSPPRGARGRRKGRPGAQSIKYVPKPEIRKTAFRRISVLQTGGETHTLRMLFFVGARATIGRPLEEQGTFPQCSHNSKGSLVQRELARQRLRDCKSVEFAEQKKIVCVRHNPSVSFHSAPPLTQGRLRSAPPVVKMKFHTGRGIWNAPLWSLCEHCKAHLTSSQGHSISSRLT